MKENNGKGTARAAVTGAVVGAGAVIAGVVALSDKKNQEKIRKAFQKAKDFVHKYAERTQTEVKEGKTTIKKVANQAIKSAEKVTKTVKKKVREI
ncbi:MAG: hypothetical protein V1487_01785 [bacterium]